MGRKIAAGAFLVAFFAALPVWSLSRIDGWVKLQCAGQPWRCTVSRFNLLSRRNDTFQVHNVSLGIRSVSYRGRRSEEYVLQFDRNAVLAARPGYRAMQALVDEMNAARLAGKSFERTLSPTGSFWLAILLVVLFAGAGLFIAIKTRVTTEQRVA